jgi:hypothetical protein
VLARIGETATQLLGQVADRVLALAQDVKEHQPLGIGEYSADFRVKPIPLRISIALIVHGCPLAISGVPAGYMQE